MRPFLYISPYFPPDSRVGALRPLKFVRHLPARGYRPIVLADAPAEPGDARLVEALPKEVVVVRDYGRATRRKIFTPKSRVRGVPGVKRWPFEGSRLHSFFERPDLVPLGPQALDIPHALAAAERLLDQYDCQAILVNADPFAAAVAGALLARRKRVPLFLDFRDPWALCSLRRPLRKRWVDSTLGKLERFAVSSSERVILNTERTRLDYAEHYRDVPAERFVCIPNHADPTLVPHPADDGAPRGRFTLLFAGTLRRFVEGDVLLALLAALERRGVTGAELGLVIAGKVPTEFLHRAAELGLSDFVELEAPVSYLDVPALLDRADLLVVLSHRDRQRIPAKIYDGALSRRPLLVVTENPELEELATRIGGAVVFAHDAIEPMADFVTKRLTGAREEVCRDFDWTSELATSRLATLLDDAIARNKASNSKAAV
jgi:glycosyltransferase involved in cell wall biosynthesis